MAGSLAHSDRPAAVRRFLGALQETLQGAATTADPPAAAALDDFARFVRDLDTARLCEPAPSPALLAVCRWWPDALQAACGPLAAALAPLGDALSWRQNPNYCRQPPDPTFLANYGYAVIAGPSGGPPRPLVVEARIALGVLLLGPRTHYPLHAHPAVEIYVTLTPDGLWWRDAGPWHRQPAGVVIHHAPNVRHAMRAGEVPLLAVYVWRGDLGTHARLVQEASTKVS